MITCLAHVGTTHDTTAIATRTVRIADRPWHSIALTQHDACYIPRPPMNFRPCEACSGTRFEKRFSKLEHEFFRCLDCGLERIDPQPSDATLAAIYGKHYYDAWGLHGQEDVVRSLKKSTFRRNLEAIPAPKRGKLLDCGAATGFLMEVAREIGFDPYGLELSEYGAGEIARQFGKDHVFQGEIEQATWADGTFDVITMYDYLEHVRDPERVLRRARALLAPGGVLSITTPSTGSFTHAVMGRHWSHYKLEHLFYFGPDSLARLLSKAGFHHVHDTRAWKTMNLRYIHHQMETYPTPGLTQVARTLGKVLPTPLLDRPFPILMGELYAHASA